MIKLVTNQLNIYKDYYDIITVEESLGILNNLEELSVDTETTGFDPYTKNLLLTQLGDQDVQIVIDNTSVSIKHYKSLLESKLLILQNAQFDLRFLFKNNIYPTKIYDTLLAECIITGGYGDDADKKDVKKEFNSKIASKFIERGLALDDLAEKYCGITLDKSIRGEINRIGITNRVIKYAADDIKYLPGIKKEQLKIIDSFKNKYKIDGKIIELEMKVALVIARMCYNGIIVDSNKYQKEVLEKVAQEVEDSTNSLDDIVLKEDRLKKYQFSQGNLFFQSRKTEINWNSSAQKLVILKLLDDSIESTGDTEIRKRFKDHEIFSNLSKYNKSKKLESSFGKKFLSHINTKTGRMHPSVWQILSTGRISMSKPNLLQIPSKGDLGKVIRSCFVPEKGYKIVGGDYSSFELAIIAELSQDPLWVNSLNKGKNLHTILCMETFDIPEDKVNDPFPYNKDMTYRAVQKTIDFGLAYGMSEFKLSNTIGVTKQQAKEIIDKFFKKVPQVKEFLDMLGLLAKERGYIKIPNPYGRIRFFPKFNVIQKYPSTKQKFKWLGEMERAGKNTPIQGLNGNTIKLALIYVQEYIDKHNLPVKILLSIYDEIQTECREDYAEEWKVILQNLMVKAAKVYIKSVPVEADCKINDYWTK